MSLIRQALDNHIAALVAAILVILFGLVSFLLGHVAYIVAFSVLELSTSTLLAASAILVVFALFVWRWLESNLEDRMRGPVLIYVLAISAMMAMAIGTYAVSGNWAIPVGALLFLISDLTVARDRFVAPGFTNRAYGLPLYFSAQIILAGSLSF